MPTNYREYAKTFNFTFPEYGRGVGSDLALAAKARFRVFRVEYKFDPKYLHDLISAGHLDEAAARQATLDWKKSAQAIPSAGDGSGT